MYLQSTKLKFGVTRLHIHVGTVRVTGLHIHVGTVRVTGLHIHVGTVRVTGLHIHVGTVSEPQSPDFVGIRFSVTWGMVVNML